MENITDGSSPAKYTVNGSTCYQFDGAFTIAIIEWSPTDAGPWIPQGFEIDTPATFTVPQGTILTTGTGWTRITAVGSCDYSIQDIRQR